MDETDIKLCLLLLNNSRLSYEEQAEKLGLSINAVHKRVKALVDLRIIRGFIARPSLTSSNAIPVWVFGRCESKHIRDVHLRLSKNDCTYWVGYSGGEFLYVGGYLRDLSELEPFSMFVINETRMSEPTVGIFPPVPAKSLGVDRLQHVDYEIISSLHKDSRKPLADIAEELHLTAKTIRNRLQRMIDKQLIDLTIDWYPDASNDIISLIHLDFFSSADKMAITSQLLQTFSPHLLFPVFFANLPNKVAYFTWTNTMKQLEELRAKLAEAKEIESTMLNVLQIGYSFDTWRDRQIEEKTRILPS
jgi:DNA-binding Lrp family transcriptional regulator